jgi:hypothetical protein
LISNLFDNEIIRYGTFQNIKLLITSMGGYLSALDRFITLHAKGYLTGRGERGLEWTFFVPKSATGPVGRNQRSSWAGRGRGD